MCVLLDFKIHWACFHSLTFRSSRHLFQTSPQTPEGPTQLKSWHPEAFQLSDAPEQSQEATKLVSNPWFGDCFCVSHLHFLKSPTWTTDPSEEEQGSGTGILERSGQVFSGWGLGILVTFSQSVWLMQAERPPCPWFEFRSTSWWSLKKSGRRPCHAGPKSGYTPVTPLAGGRLHDYDTMIFSPIISHQTLHLHVGF